MRVLKASSAELAFTVAGAGFGLTHVGAGAIAGQVGLTGVAFVVLAATGVVCTGTVPSETGLFGIDGVGVTGDGVAFIGTHPFIVLPFAWFAAATGEGVGVGAGVPVGVGVVATGVTGAGVGLTGCT